MHKAITSRSMYVTAAEHAVSEIGNYGNLNAAQKEAAKQYDGLVEMIKGQTGCDSSSENLKLLAALETLMTIAKLAVPKEAFDVAFTAHYLDELMSLNEQYTDNRSGAR